MTVHHAVRHSIDFALLVLILGMGLSGLVYFKYDVASQIAVVAIWGILYIFWGVFHHWHDRNLTGKVVMEYIAIAALVDFILALFLLRV